MNDNRIAVLMTCYNRKEKTIACLTRLNAQENIENNLIKVFLVDDGSTDGTRDAVMSQFSDVEIIEGDGNLFWCGGMRKAFGIALKQVFDFYLWLNDDTMLNKDALSILLKTYYLLKRKTGRDVIIVGSVRDGSSLTYGGSLLGPWWNPTHYKMVEPSTVPQPCDLFHGNCVLISGQVSELTGNMSDLYIHGPGDKDYALRAAEKGFDSWICPGFIGTCSRNNLIERWKDKKLSIKERVDALNHPVVIARVKDWIVYSRKYHKILYPYFWALSTLRLQCPKLYLILKTLR